MNPLFAGMAVSAVGKLLGGRARKKAAKAVVESAEQERTRAEEYGDYIYGQTQADQDRAIAYRQMDEARLKAATGYDLQKLRDDAEKAGFNPLTILQATGGAGYDGRGAVLSTPFISLADAFARKADLVMAAGVNVLNAKQGVAAASGYVGDAVQGLGDGLADYGMSQLQMKHEARMLEMTLRGNTSSPGAVRGTRVNGGSSGRSAPLVGAARVAGGREVFGPANPFETVSIYSPSNQPLRVSRSWAERNGFKAGDQFAPGDFENWLGESGQAASFGYSIDPYGRIVKAEGSSPAFSALPVPVKLGAIWLRNIARAAASPATSSYVNPQYESWGAM